MASNERKIPKGARVVDWSPGLNTRSLPLPIILSGSSHHCGCCAATGCLLTPLSFFLEIPLPPTDRTMILEIPARRNLRFPCSRPRNPTTNRPKAIRHHRENQTVLLMLLLLAMIAKRQDDHNEQTVRNGERCPSEQL